MRIAFLTNILTPYRIFFYDCLSKQLGAENLKVFVMTEELPLRPWKYSDLKREYTELLKGKKIFIHGDDYLFSYHVNQTISAFGPDILIIAGSWTYPTTWQVMLSKRMKKQTRIYFWTESHNHTGLSNTTKTSPMIRRIKQSIMKKFDGFCVPGKYALETISELVDVEQKKIVRLPNIIDNSYFVVANTLRNKKEELREERNISNDAYVFFTPARMCALKGQIPFFTNVADAVIGKDVIFLLAGEGPDRDEIEKLGKEFGMNIRFCNYQNQEQIREWLAISDCFLLPSLSDSNPLSNIEAAWAGLPLCVSEYVGNWPELVEDGVNGVVFDTLNKASVCEKIRFMIDQDKAWLEQAGAISCQKANEGFDSEKETRKFLEAIEEVTRT